MIAESPITSVQNPVVKHLVKLRTDGRYRRQQGRLLICSRKLIAELSTHTPPLAHYGEGGRPISESVLKKITALPAPEGVAAEFPLPQQSLLKNLSPLLALDQISDPGNLGTLVRTALALGWRGLFLLPGCVDPFHEKVIRASRGALFHLPWREGSWEELETLQQEGGLTPLVADMGGKTLTTLPEQKKPLLLLSHEGEGVSEKGKHFGESISIPISPQVESLNVAAAGAILMYHLGRDL